jgi:hypothetical protein
MTEILFSRPVLVLTAALALAVAVPAAVASSAADPPRNTTMPTIAGAARAGVTLRVWPGRWSGTQPIRFSYQWVRCSSRMSDCANVRGADDRDFRLGSADVGRRLLVSVRASNSAGGSVAQASTPVVAPPAAAPVNTATPVVTGTPQEGQTLTASSGSWGGTEPFSFAYQWYRCAANGASCSPIIGATSATFALTKADVNLTVRVAVTARNAAGSRSSTSAAAGPVTAAPPPGPDGQIRLPDGRVSIPVTSVSLPERLIVTDVRFSPNPVRSRRDPITARIRVADTRGFVVRDALVFLRATPLLTTTPPEQATQQDGTVTLQLLPRASFPLKRGQNVQFFVRARKLGENPLAGVSTRRLVQVRTASAG